MITIKTEKITKDFVLGIMNELFPCESAIKSDYCQGISINLCENENGYSNHFWI